MTEYDDKDKKPAEKFRTPSILNKAEFRKLVLRCGKERTGWLPERVAASFIEDAETMLRMRIMQAVKKHPSVGKTIKEWQ
jgi:hypothetical protein